MALGDASHLHLRGHSRTSRIREILFRIFYSTSFTIVFLLTIAFCCAGPIDSLYQSHKRGRYIDIFLLSGVYFLTALIMVFLYASRLYTNRSILRDIPKTYIPLDKNELGNKRVWRLIEDCKSRSAVIAYLARPRARRIEVDAERSYMRDRINVLLKPEHSKEYRIFEPQWGTISHPGWTGPAGFAKDTPDLRYESVVNELTDLIEARVVSLAPVDDDGQIDENVIDVLKRPEEAGMRQYIAFLLSIDVLDDNSLTLAFLTLYERARFAPDPLSEHEFKALMRMFAEVLRNMRPPDLTRLDLPIYDSDPDTPSKRPRPDEPFPAHKPDQRLLASSSSIRSSTTDSSSIAGSVRFHRLDHSNPTRNTSFATAYPDRLPSQNPPRMSNDSVRSLSTNSAYHDAENDQTEDTDGDWANPTSRPPFFRARSSQSAISQRSRGTKGSSRPRLGHRNTSSRNTDAKSKRSRIRRAITSRLSYESIAPARAGSVAGPSAGTASLHSTRSNGSGSVIRLNPQYDGSRDQLPFEYITKVPTRDRPGGDEDQQSGSVRTR